MSKRSFASAFAALGYKPSVERLYWQVLGASGTALETVSASLVRSPEQLLVDLKPLIDDDIVTVAVDQAERVLRVLPPSRALSLLVAREAARSARVASRLEDLAQAIPLVARESRGRVLGDPIDGAIYTGEVPQLFHEWLEQTTGDLLWLRPDQWRMTHEPELLVRIARQISLGRRSRAIYPLAALTGAPDVLRARARAGEQIRLVAQVPTRLSIMGTTHALVPEQPGLATSRRLAIYQPGLVQVLRLFFEQVWDQGTSLPEFDLGAPRPDLRRILLQQLATGEKDEQIARTMKLSLRTVRRRIAELMIELGVDTRFQAGVEAARRGWL